MKKQKQVNVRTVQIRAHYHTKTLTGKKLIYSKLI